MATLANDTILLIEDNHQDAHLMERIVSLHPNNLKMKWIDDAEKALAHLSSCRRDDYLLIFLDIKMPKLTGLEILHALSQNNRLTELPTIIVLTSSSQEKDILAVQRYGIVGFQTKPEGYKEQKQLFNNIIDQQLKPHSL